LEILLDQKSVFENKAISELSKNLKLNKTNVDIIKEKIVLEV